MPESARASDFAVAAAKQSSNVPSDARMVVAQGHFGGITMRLGFTWPVHSFELVELVAFAAAIGAACRSLPTAVHRGLTAGNGRNSGRPSASPVHGTQRPCRCGRQSSYTDAYGNPLIVPAGYGQQCAAAAAAAGDCGGYDGCDGGARAAAMADATAAAIAAMVMAPMAGGFNSCMPMGCGGTDPPIGYDLMNDVGMEGDLVDQRGPHYFDIRAEAVYLHRDVDVRTKTSTSRRSTSATRSCFRIRTSWISMNKPGFRIIGRYDICPLAVLEFGYTGIFGWEDSASVDRPDEQPVFVVSRPAPGTGLFGTDPVGVNIVGRPESGIGAGVEAQHLDRVRFAVGGNQLPPILARLHAADFRHAAGRLPLHEAGRRLRVRHARLGTATQLPGRPAGRAGIRRRCENNLAGFQTGGDIWIGLCQGLRFGAEAKVGYLQQPLRC